MRKIQILDRRIWKLDLNESKIDEWLEKIILDEEDIDSAKLHLKHLLCNVIYVGINEYRALLKSTFEDIFEYQLIEKIRKEIQNKFDFQKIKEELNNEINNTRFVSLGNPSDSGSLILYFFRQVNNLKRELFINDSDILDIKENGEFSLKHKKVTRYVFLDDFCGSGSQAIRFAKRKIMNLKQVNSNVEFVYLSLFGSSKGIEKIKSELLYDRVSSYHILDESYKSFSAKSRIFSSENSFLSKEKCELIVRRFGNMISKGKPMGFDNGQFLFTFFYNTPNNSLPIFWKESEENSFVPFFKRFEKNYDGILS